MPHKPDDLYAAKFSTSHGPKKRLAQASTARYSSLNVVIIVMFNIKALNVAPAPGCNHVIQKRIQNLRASFNSNTDVTFFGNRS